MQSETIIAVDPGGTTGLCALDFQGEIVVDQLGPQGHHIDFFLHLERKEPLAIVCETFQQRAVEGVDLTAIEYIGIVKLYADLYPARVVWQSKSQTEFWTDEKIKKIGLWKPGLPHAMDAQRHLMSYLLKLGHPISKKWLRQLK